MIDIKFLRENPEKVQKAISSKQISFDVNKFLEIDKKKRVLDQEFQKIQEQQNSFQKGIEGKPTEEQINRGRELRNQSDKLAHEIYDVQNKWFELLWEIPNLPKDDIKVGKDDSENEVIKKWGDPKKFDFTPKDHLELGEDLDLIDVKRAAKVSGTRFAYLKNEAVLLEFALVQLALETLIKEGFIPIVPPVLINQEITQGLGYWQGGGSQDYYLVGEPAEGKNFYLVGTAEHSIVPMHKDEIFNKKDLPKRYVGFSSAFRREAGSYGKDTKGIFRVHQFDKVEMVSFVAQEDSEKEYDYLLSLEEKLFQLLEIPYQVVKMCTGDLGFPAAAKKDIEAWMPGQQRYREVTSVSQVTDFQSRRLDIKYHDGNEKKFVNILNGTAFSTNRPIIAILENYQQEDGSILIPKVLQKYVGKEKISPKK